MYLHTHNSQDTAMKIKIMYIEDEPALGKIVKETLEKKGFEVHWETDGAKVMGRLYSYIPDIFVLDIMLPNIDGYSLCRNIKKLHPAIPVIFLTAKVETADLVKGFEAGGTDYIRKPFSIEELIVRINNQMQMKGNFVRKEELAEEIPLGRYQFYPKRFELHSPSKIIKLSNRDMEVLSLLAANLNRITERRMLLLSVWGDDSFFNSRNLDVYIRKLRSYFQEDESIEIQTLKGKGYLFLVTA